MGLFEDTNLCVSDSRCYGLQCRSCYRSRTEFGISLLCTMMQSLNDIPHCVQVCHSRQACHNHAKGCAAGPPHSWRACLIML